MESGGPIPQGLSDIERSRARRAAKQRQIRRRRRLTAGGLVVLIALVVAAVVGLGGKQGAPSAGGGARKAAHVVVRNGPHGHEAVPILTFHVISPAPPGAPFPLLYVSEPLFAADMQALKDAGYVGVTLDQVWDNWHHGTPLPPGKPIVITFDNGYYSQYLAAYPVLKALGWVADENVQLLGLPPSQGGISRRQTRLLVKAGWELDTQGENHFDMVGMSASELHYQIVDARRTLQRRYHVPVNWFCYPSGDYDATVIAALRAAGFRGSTTVDSGLASPQSDPFTLPRLRVEPDETPADVLDSIEANRDDPPPGPSYNG
jgi:peptidoglycan/xylan/chitin deacetylase (PgdA/CDA1 family)